MADYLKGLFGGPKTAAPSAGDSDFADFAEAPDPAPASPPVTATSAYNPSFATSAPTLQYTKWYRVWERTSPADFKAEAIIFPFILLVVAIHVWGRGRNRRMANNWARAHGPTLRNEFAVVGFGGRKALTIDDAQSEGLAKAMASESLVHPEEVLKEKTAHEFVSYATGRQNTAFLDVKITMIKRYNPLTYLIEFVLSIFFDSMKAPTERIEATSYSFDGHEKDIVPVRTQQEQDILEANAKSYHSAYDGFVWALVHKDSMRHLREDRYDVSLTFTKDHAKLPVWATVMSESAEITDFLLTPELVKAVEEAGPDLFENLIISDQPLDKPKKLSEATPRKRLALSMRLPSGTSTDAYKSTLTLFNYFLRLPDTLASSAHFRPEATRKVRATREEEIRKLKKVDDEEKADERKSEADKKKKTDRDAKLKNMSADDQRKFLDKEREKDQRKQGKKMQKKG